MRFVSRILIAGTAPIVLAGACSGDRRHLDPTPRVDAGGTVDGGGSEDGRDADRGDTPSPFSTEFRFRNDTDAPLFIHKGCANLDYSISSSSSGFRDRLGPDFYCACSCDSPTCTGGIVCGQCPLPEGVQVPVGGSVAVAWDAILRTYERRPYPSGEGTYSCLLSKQLPAAGYRVSIRVFDNVMAATTNVGGRTVTRDFALANGGNVVDVPLAASALDTCDLTPDAPAPLCTGTEARDAPCSLREPLGFAWEGGNGFYAESSQLTPPTTYVHERVSYRTPPEPDVNCTAIIPRCARDSRVVTTADIVRVTTEPSVLAAFAKDTPIYGNDDRENDGVVLILRRPDGTSLAIGSSCESCIPGPIPRPLTLALAALPQVLGLLEQQIFATPACSAFGPAFRY